MHSIKEINARAGKQAEEDQQLKRAMVNSLSGLSAALMNRLQAPVATSTLSPALDYQSLENRLTSFKGEFKQDIMEAIRDAFVSRNSNNTNSSNNNGHNSNNNGHNSSNGNNSNNNANRSNSSNSSFNANDNAW
jgi:hypothetical protein